MLSKITIEMDFMKASPFIKVFCNPSPDLRDQAIQAFFERLSQKSRWATITYEAGGAEIGIQGGNSYSIWKVTPLTPWELREEAKLMIAMADYVEGVQTIPLPQDHLEAN